MTICGKPNDDRPRPALLAPAPMRVAGRAGVRAENAGSMEGVHTLPVPGGVLITSPLRSVSALMNEAAASLLSRGASHPELDELAAALAAPGTPPCAHSGPIRPAFLGIVSTRSCNLSCVYCGFRAATAPPNQMRLDTAVAAVDWMAETVRRTGGNTLQVHFFGGEPLVAGEVIDAAVHRARLVAARLGLVPRFELSTNGVCSPSRAGFLGDYFDAVVLSFDGPQQVHDQLRPMGRRGSFDAVARTARILGESTTELCFRTCVTQQNVAMLEQTTRWFCETFNPSVINLETLQPTPESDAAGLAPPEPHEFAAHYLRALRVARDLGVELVYSAADTGQPRNTFCPVGRDTVIVSPDGTLSSCYLLAADWQRRGLDLVVGRIDHRGEVWIDDTAVQRLRTMVASKPPRCTGCFCRYWCAGGCHVNHSYPGCAGTFDAFCVQTRLVTVLILLERLGAHATVDRLLGDRDAMVALGGGEQLSLATATTSDTLLPQPGAGQSEAAFEPIPSGGADRASYAITLRGVIVFCEGIHRVLGEVEAALWDLLARGYPVGEATRLVAAIGRIDQARAERLVQRSLAEWVEAGLMERADA